MKKFEASDYAAGLALLDTAFATTGDPDLRLNAAVAYEQWGGHCVEALSAYDSYFRLCDGRTCANLENARKRLAQAQTRCQSALAVTTAPPGARVRLDTADIGRAPLTSRVLPGTHHVEVSLDGHGAAETTVETLAGTSHHLVLTLAADPDLVGHPLAPPVAPAVRTAAWVTLGAGLLAAGVGGTFLGLHVGARDDRNAAADDAGVSGARLADLEDTANRDWIIGWSGVSVGALALLAGGTLWYSTRDTEVEAVGATADSPHGQTHSFSSGGRF